MGARVQARGRLRCAHVCSASVQGRARGASMRPCKHLPAHAFFCMLATLHAHGLCIQRHATRRGVRGGGRAQVFRNAQKIVERELQTVLANAEDLAKRPVTSPEVAREVGASIGNLLHRVQHLERRLGEINAEELKCLDRVETRLKYLEQSVEVCARLCVRALGVLGGSLTDRKQAPTSAD